LNEMLERFVHMRSMQLHKVRRIGQLREPELLVETMRIVRCEHEAPEFLKIRVREDELHEPFGEAFSAMRLKYEYVREIRKGGLVSDNPSKSHLPALKEDAKAQRTFNGTLDDRAWDAR